MQPFQRSSVPRLLTPEQKQQVKKKASTRNPWHAGTLERRMTDANLQKTTRSVDPSISTEIYSMTNTVTAEDLTLLAEIRQRRGYHLACVLIEQIRDRKVGHVRYTRLAHFPTIERLCDLLQLHFCGLQLFQETLAVALADSGFTVLFVDGQLITDMSDEFLLQLRAQDGYKPGNSNRFAKHSDALTPAASSTVH